MAQSAIIKSAKQWARTGAALLIIASAAAAIPAHAQTGAEPPRANAVFERAKALHDATGGQRDLEGAAALYKQAAEMGSNFACINLGYMYFTGEGVTKSYRISRSWYLAAANNGNADAQRMMSVFHKNGLGVNANPKIAALWADRARTGWVKPAQPLASALTSKKDTTEIYNISGAAATSAPAVKPVTAPAVDAAAAQAAAKAKAERLALKRRQNIEKRAQLAKAAKAAKIAAAAKVANPKPAVKNQNSPHTVLWLLLLSVLGLGLTGAIAVFTERYRRVKAVSDKAQFVRAFYARHRAILKSSYTKAQDNQGVIICDARDPWVRSALVLMTRFAQKHELITANPMRLTADVIKAIGSDNGEVEALLMPLMPDVEDVLIEDLSGEFIKDPAKAGFAELFKGMLQNRNIDDSNAGLHAAQ